MNNSNSSHFVKRRDQHEVSQVNFLFVPLLYLVLQLWHWRIKIQFYAVQIGQLNIAKHANGSPLGLIESVITKGTVCLYLGLCITALLLIVNTNICKHNGIKSSISPLYTSVPISDLFYTFIHLYLVKRNNFQMTPITRTITKDLMSMILLMIKITLDENKNCLCAYLSLIAMIFLRTIMFN